MTREKYKKVEDLIKKLELSVRNCDNKAVRHAYLLGVATEQAYFIKDKIIEREISRLIAKFELDCRCNPLPK